MVLLWGVGGSFFLTVFFTEVFFLGATFLGIIIIFHLSEYIY